MTYGYPLCAPLCVCHAAPRTLKNAILEYYDFLWNSVQRMDEASVMADLPPLMQLQIDIVVCDTFAAYGPPHATRP